MLGAHGFNCERLFLEPDFARFSLAAVVSVAADSAQPFRDALGSSPGDAEIERAAFAASLQGVAPLLAATSDLDLLPGEVAEFLRFEARQSTARSEALLAALAQVEAALFREGIHVVALKGAALVLTGAAEPGFRPMADLDLLLAEPKKMEKATRALGAVGWRPLSETRRHRVFGRDGERVLRPGCEDPGNPIRVEIHYNLRIPILGRFFDLTKDVLAEAEPFEHDGTRVLVEAGNALRRHLLVHAAEDFAAAGLRGVLAHDFRLLARREGPLRIGLSDSDRKSGLAPLAYAARAIERLFPGSFAPEFLAMLCGGVQSIFLERADALPPLRKTRPPLGWTERALSLAESPSAKIRLFARTVLPPLDEVRINVVSGATGVALWLVWLKLFFRRAGRFLGRGQPGRDRALPPLALGPGELRIHERFGPTTVNRGAVLYECEWDGGIFESGVMLGGIFRSGEFRDGVVWTTLWKGGVWTGGFWHNGFSPEGAYRPRGAFPGSPVTNAEAPESPVETHASPRATVFTASVFGDVPRIWLACLRRSLPAGDVRFEIFDDSPEGSLDGKLLPDATLLRRSAERPDFQVAYADALRRVSTPFLAFVDTDVFWLSRDTWPRVMREFERPRVAGVSCVSRMSTESPGTFAVVMRTEIYRDIVRNVPGAFAAFAKREAVGGAPGRWIGDDTGDRVSRAVREAGFELPLLDLPTGALVKFDAITMTRLLAAWVGEETILRMAVTNPYFRRGCLGGFALAGVHDGLFADGPRFGRPVSATRLWRSLLFHPRSFARASRDFAEFRRGAERIRRFLGSPPRAATTSS